MWELDCEEGWVLKNWCFWTVVLEKTLESPLDCKEIKPVHSEGDQPWVFFGRNDAKAETPILWPPQAKSWLIGKDSDAGRDWGQEEKGMTEDEMAGWRHWLDGLESEWTPGLVMDREAWRAVIHGVAKSRTLLSDWTDWATPLSTGDPMVCGCLTAQMILIALCVIMLLKWLGKLLTLQWNITMTKDFLAGLTVEWHPIVLNKQIGPEQWDIWKLAASTEELGT